MIMSVSFFEVIVSVCKAIHKCIKTKGLGYLEIHMGYNVVIRWMRTHTRELRRESMVKVFRWQQNCIMSPTGISLWNEFQRVGAATNEALVPIFASTLGEKK